MADWNWNEVKTEYITTKTSYRKLCKKHGIPFSTLQARARQEDWVRLREQHNDNIVTNSCKKVEEKASNYRVHLYELAMKVALQLTEVVDETNLLNLMAMGIKPKDITGAIKDLEDVLHIKSDADLEEQQARINKLRKEAEKNDDDKKPNEIKITIAGGEDSWKQ